MKFLANEINNNIKMYSQGWKKKVVTENGDLSENSKY